MRILTTVAALAGLTFASMAAAVAASEDLPGWMTGAWQQTRGDRWTEERWSAPSAGVMLGSGRSGRGTKLADWETTRIQIEADGKPAFIAMPNGGAPVRFALISSHPKEIVFANPSHDYPQRIRYWRDGDALMAETALIDGSKARQWRYTRAKPR